MTGGCRPNGFGSPEALPETVLIDQSGVVRAKFRPDQQGVTVQSLAAAVLPLMSTRHVAAAAARCGIVAGWRKWDKWTGLSRPRRAGSLFEAAVFPDPAEAAVCRRPLADAVRLAVAKLPFIAATIAWIESPMAIHLDQARNSP